MESETKKTSSDFSITRMVSLNEIINRISIFAPSALYRDPSTRNDSIFLETLVPFNRIAAALRGTDFMPSLDEVFNEEYAQEILHRYLEIEKRRSWAAQQIKNWQTSLVKRKPSSLMFWINCSPDREKSDPMKLWSEIQKLLAAFFSATEKVLAISKILDLKEASIVEAFRLMANSSHTPRFIEIALSEKQAQYLMSDILPIIIKANAKQIAPLISPAKGRLPRINDSRFDDGALAAIMKIVEDKDDYHNCTADELKKHIKEKLNDMSETGDGKFYLGIKSREYHFRILNKPEALSSKRLNIRIESVLQALSRSIFPAPNFATELTPRHKKTLLK